MVAWPERLRATAAPSSVLGAPAESKSRSAGAGAAAALRSRGVSFLELVAVVAAPVLAFGVRLTPLRWMLMLLVKSSGSLQADRSPSLVAAVGAVEDGWSCCFRFRRETATAVWWQLEADALSKSRFWCLRLMDHAAFQQCWSSSSLWCEVHQDMSAPISHYYVFTGHNSYLTGNQLNSDSSDIPIITALERGVRVIELDMWPNSAKNRVEILHGGTLTAPVDIMRCLKSIKDHAFTASTYPLVITLEDHLTADLQAKVAEMIRETFGDLLYVPSSDTLNEFPSPEALMRRIIISTKPPEEFKEFLKAQDNQKNSDQTAKLAEEGSLRRIDSNADDSDGKDELDEEDDDESEEEDPKFRQDTACEYRKLITIHAGKPKGHLRDALKVDPDKVRRLSLSETQLSKATVSHGADIIRFTEKNILRVYPKGTRINSSNYDPINAWTHGAQMVAFNMQGHDKSLRLMQGFFRANGGCGYVKKPDFLLKTGPNGEVFDPKATMPVKKTLKVKVYMGDGWRIDFSKTHFDAFSPPDFYARVGIAGVRADCVMKKTRTIEDQWVPVWDEEFTFPLTVPELALLRVEVQEYDMSEKHDFGGQTCLPVMELKQGIRAVPLHDRKGNRYKSVRLLMRFELV